MPNKRRRETTARRRLTRQSKQIANKQLSAQKRISGRQQQGRKSMQKAAAKMFKGREPPAKMTSVPEVRLSVSWTEEAPKQKEKPSINPRTPIVVIKRLSPNTISSWSSGADSETGSSGSNDSRAAYVAAQQNSKDREQQQQQQEEERPKQQQIEEQQQLKQEQKDRWLQLQEEKYQLQLRQLQQKKQEQEQLQELKQEQIEKKEEKEEKKEEPEEELPVTSSNIMVVGTTLNLGNGDNSGIVSIASSPTLSLRETPSPSPDISTDEHFLEIIRPRMKEMNARQKLFFKTRIFEALIATLDNATDFPTGGEEQESNHVPPSTLRYFTDDELQIIRKLVSMTMLGKHTAETASTRVVVKRPRK